MRSDRDRPDQVARKFGFELINLSKFAARSAVGFGLFAPFAGEARAILGLMSVSLVVFAAFMALLAAAVVLQVTSVSGSFEL